jgi:hypothetical protein
MAEKPHLFRVEQPIERPFTCGDLAILLGLTVLLYLGVRLAHDVPQVIQDPKIDLTPASLPLYASLSVGRMLVMLKFLPVTHDVFYLELEGSKV